MSDSYDTEAFRCTMECDDLVPDEREPESRYGTIGKGDGVFCAASGCTKTKHSKSKYCAYHKTHRPRSAEAYQRMVERQ